jgi:hypothetical protein
MSVNGITSTSSAYENYQTTQAAKTTTDTAASSVSPTEEAAAVYEPSSTSETTASTAKTYTQNTELVNKLKADAEAHTQQLQNIVQQLMVKQGQTYNTANDIWSFLASGNFTVDAATKAQAEEDISDDGYWGVEQTSDRIIDFATALTGGDPDKIERCAKHLRRATSRLKRPGAASFLTFPRKPTMRSWKNLISWQRKPD